MSEMSFLINDQSTGGGTPVVRVTIKENPDGTVTIRIEQLLGAGNYLGDLRGFFMDINEGLLGSLSVTSSKMTLADGTSVSTNSAYTSGDDSVSRAGSSSNNMNGMLGSDGGFDFGIEIGSEGIGKNGDDVRGFEFTLDSSTRDITLADFANANFGVRITSVGLDTNGDGVIDTARTGSVKMLEQSAATTGPNVTVFVDDDTFGGQTGGTGDKDDALNTVGVLAHTYASGSVVLTGAQFANYLDLQVTTLNASTIVISQMQDGALVAVLKIQITNAANGDYQVTQLATVRHPAGGDENDILLTIGYNAVSSDGDTASGILSININDASVHLLESSVLTGAVTEDGTLTASGSVNFVAADGATAALDAGATTLTYTPVGGTPTTTLLAGLDGDAIRAALTLNASGSWSFDASALNLDPLDDGETLTLKYKVVVTDADGDSAIEFITITINGKDDQPTLGVVTAGSIAEVDQSASTTSSGLSGTLVGDDVDAGDTLTYGVSGGVAGSYLAGAYDLAKVGTYGTLYVNSASGAYSYVPNAAAIEALDDGDAESDSFTMTVSDSDGPTVDQTYTVNVSGADDAPTLGVVTAGSIAEVDQSASTTGSGLSGTLVGDDVDAGDTLTYGVSGGVAGSYLAGAYDLARVGTYGTLYVNSASGAYSYVPNAAAIEALDDGDAESDSFTMTVSDSDGPTVDQTYTVNVSGADDAPTLGVVTAGSIAEVDQSASTTSSGLSGTLVGDDVDAGDTLTYGVSGGVAGSYLAGAYDLAKVGTYGTLYVNSTSGAYSYVPNAAAIEALDDGDAESDSFTMTVSDSDGPTVDQTYTVNVSGADDAPTSSNGSGSVNEDNVLNGTLPVANDIDGDAVTYALGAQAANGVAVVNADGSFSYTPNANFFGNDSFTFSISDGDDGVVIYTYNVTVNPVNDAPVNTVPLGSQSATAGTALSIGGVSVLDIDSATLTTTISVSHGTLSVAAGSGATVGTNGTATVTISGTQAQINAALAGLSYTATAGYSGSDTLVVNTSDGSLSDVDNVAINVTAPVNNNAPVAKRDVIVVSNNTSAVFIPASWLLANDTDPNNDTLFITNLTPTVPSGWTVSVQQSGGIITGFTVTTPNANSVQTMSFSYVVSDGNGNEQSVTSVIQTPGSPSNDGKNTIDLTSVEYNYSYIDAMGQDDTVIGGTSTPLVLDGTVGNDVFKGGTGDDRLDAKGGHNILTGGDGSDEFVFGNFIGQTNHITDFNAGTSSTSVDRIVLDVGATGNAFSVGNNDNVINPGELFINGSTSFASAAAVQTYIDGQAGAQGAFFVVFNAQLGHAGIYYDANPSAVGGATLVAELDNITTLGGMANFNTGDFLFN